MKSPMDTLVDQACGFDPAEADNLWKKLDVERRDAVMQAIDELIAWWLSKRPEGWSKRRHLANPLVNRHLGLLEECALATSAARLVRLGWTVPRRRKAR